MSGHTVTPRRRDVFRLAASVALTLVGGAACDGDDGRQASPHGSSPPAPSTVAVATPGTTPATAVTVAAPVEVLLVTNATGRHVSFVDPDRGFIARVEVGAAPWGIALAPGGRAYVSTAEGVAVVDTVRRERVAQIPYRATVGPARTGEYRPGGMGIAASADGRRVYVAVYLPGGDSRLEVIDTAAAAVVVELPVGVRPFQVLVSADGRDMYTIDHDSYSVTVVDGESLRSRTVAVAPLGRGAYDKPHYAALTPDGWLLLPVQGRTLVRLDPRTGEGSTRQLSADTHQHGVALSPDGRRLLIVGTGPAGGAAGKPSLSLIDLESGSEFVLPLSRPHEHVTLSADGRRAYLTGGYLLSGGWDGLTVVDLERMTVREVPVPERPQDIAVLR